jgi:hypothetical protein
MSSDEVRDRVLMRRAAGLKEGRDAAGLFLHVPGLAKLTPSFDAGRSSHADHIEDSEDSTRLHHMIDFNVQHYTDCSHEWNMNSTVES